MTSDAKYIRDYRKEIPGALNEDRSAWVFPPVITTTSHGKQSSWQVRVQLYKAGAVNNPTFVTINDKYFDSKNAVEHEGVKLNGWIKVDTGIAGNINKRVPTEVTTGKNIGKASATNVFTQALRDALGQYNRQLKKAHFEAKAATADNANPDVIPADTAPVAIASCPELLPPMLAQVLTKWPESTTYLQPKFNGVRSVIVLGCGDNPNIIMYSRRRNLYPEFTYIKDELMAVLKDYHTQGKKLYLDGELYKHGVALQDISGYARREDKNTDTKLDFMLYDCFVENDRGLKYSERKSILDDIFTKYKFTYVKQVATTQCESRECADVIFKQALADGFEGAMVRLDVPYEFSFNEYHSRVLLKMKPVFDAEMEVVGYTSSGKGKAAGALMIVCTTARDDPAHPPKEFPVTPAMTLPERQALAKQMAVIEPNGKTHFANQWLGKKVIVEYDELSKDNLPLRARTRLQIRTWD